MTAPGGHDMIKPNGESSEGILTIQTLSLCGRLAVDYCMGFICFHSLRTLKARLDINFILIFMGDSRQGFSIDRWENKQILDGAGINQLCGFVLGKFCWSNLTEFDVICMR